MALKANPVGTHVAYMIARSVWLCACITVCQSINQIVNDINDIVLGTNRGPTDKSSVQ